MKTLTLAFCICVFPALSACNGQVLDVDAEGGGQTGEPTDGTVVYSGYSAEWDRIRVTFTSLSESDVKGTIVFGEGTPPPVDPTVAYPPQQRQGSAITYGLIPEFVYPLVEATREDERVRFSVLDSAIFEEWCTPQKPIAQPEGSEIAYGCIPFVDGGLDCSGGDYSACLNDKDGQSAVVSWDMWAMCQAYLGACECDAQSCRAVTRADVAFDVRLDGDELNGTINDEDVFLKRE